MKPLEVWTCQRAENFKKKLSKIPKNNYEQQWYRRRAYKLSAAAARRSTKVGGGGAHKLSAAARPAHGSSCRVCAKQRIRQWCQQFASRWFCSISLTSVYSGVGELDGQSLNV